MKLASLLIALNISLPLTMLPMQLAIGYDGSPVVITPKLMIEACES